MSIYRRPKDGVPAGDAIPFAFDGVYHLFHLSSPPGTIAYPIVSARPGVTFDPAIS